MTLAYFSNAAFWPAMMRALRCMQKTSTRILPDVSSDRQGWRSYEWRIQQLIAETHTAVIGQNIRPQLAVSLWIGWKEKRWLLILAVAALLACYPAIVLLLQYNARPIAFFAFGVLVQCPGYAVKSSVLSGPVAESVLLVTILPWSASGVRSCPVTVLMKLILSL